MLCPHRPNFYPITATQVSDAELALAPPSINFTRKRRRGARREGELYENRVQSHLLEEYPDKYVVSPWLRYRNGAARLEWCQPDGLLVDFLSGLVTVVEIKLKHTSDAWWQIRHKYEPVLRNLFSDDWQFSSLEVVRWFDPHTRFPERFHLTAAAHECRANRFHVYIWGGK